MIASVIPAVRLPKNLVAFDYEVPVEIENKIKIGGIAQINFNGRNVVGLIVDLKKNAVLNKKIKKIETLEASVDDIWRDIVLWTANYYLAPATLTLKTALPDFPKKSRTDFLNIGENATTPRIPKGRLSELEAIKKENSLRIYDDPRIKIAGIVKLLKLTKNQALILSPTVKSAQSLYNSVKTIFGDKAAILHSDLSKSFYFEEWKKILNGGARVIIGTRQAIFAPVLNLETIIFDDGDSDDFKQYDQNPRYDARKVAEFIAKKRNTALIFWSQFPRPEDFYAAKKIIKLISPASGARIINLQNRFKAGSSLITDATEDAISTSLQKRKKAVLFLNRRGIGSALFCRDCGQTQHCAECGSLLAIHEKKMRCHRCKKDEPMPLSCPKCHGSNLKNLGSGTKKIETELTKFFPQSHVARLDKDSEKLPDDFDILIGTELLLKYADKLSNLGLVAALQMCDSPKSDRGIFETLKILVKLKNLAANSSAEFIIQSDDPENEALKRLNDIEDFLKSELHERETFGYPPFGHFIRIFCQDKNQNAVETAGGLVFEKLKKELGDADVFTLQNKILKVRGRYRFNIILKTTNKNFDIAKNKVKYLVPRDFHIDVDPINLND
jgi:primosomal protein N' (replication factor Y)